MKRIGLIVVCCFVYIASAHSQGCFDQYTSLFKQRGAKPIPNGKQRVVIATKPQQGEQQCFLGRVEVKNGEFVPPVWIEKEDGSLEVAHKDLDPATQRVPQADKRRITNGMSYTFQTVDGESIRLFLIDFLAEKPKANKSAPAANSLE